MSFNRLNPAIARQLKRHIVFDVIVIAIAVALSYQLFSRWDVYELMHGWLEHNDDSELDELIPLAFVFAIGMTYFSTRRWLDSRMLMLLYSEQADKDPLTHLYNRRKLDWELEHLDKQNHRYESTFSILLIDIDFFKQVNDQYGHEVGDTVLVNMARALRNNIRSIDIVGRWGGEEFMVVCPYCDQTQAAELAERIRETVANIDFKPKGQVTISIGVCDNRNRTTPESIREADQALYQAKHDGRNCVRCAPEKDRN